MMGRLLRWCTPDHALRIAPPTNKPTPAPIPYRPTGFIELDRALRIPPPRNTPTPPRNTPTPPSDTPTPHNPPIIRGVLDMVGRMVGAYSAAIRQQR